LRRASTGTAQRQPLPAAGGGPAGLYFAILMKKAGRRCDITVYERNRPDDTFGFGVVFSDATLDNFEKYDLESYRRITQEFAYWDDIAVHFRGTVHRVGGNGFCGCSRRTLLKILQERAARTRRRARFQTEIDDRRFADADLSSRRRHQQPHPRAKYADAFRPRSICARTSSPGWARRGRSTPSPSSSRRPSGASFIAHAYQYEPGQSTWVFETDPETFRARRARPGWTRRNRREILEARVRRWFLAGHRCSPTARCGAISR
jgi:anthraniloyl-CoA monooxygenase